MSRLAGAQRLIRLLITMFVRRRSRNWTGLIATAIVGGTVLLVINCQRQSDTPSDQENGGQEASSGVRTVVFCHWNMENLFDDRDDKRRQPDEDYDAWFVADVDARTRKYRRITEALLDSTTDRGHHRGNEIESYRAAELLGIAQCISGWRVEVRVRRHEGTRRRPAYRACVISRFPITELDTGKRQRILSTRSCQWSQPCDRRIALDIALVGQRRQRHSRTLRIRQHHSRSLPRAIRINPNVVTLSAATSTTAHRRNRSLRTFD